MQVGGCVNNLNTQCSPCDDCSETNPITGEISYNYHMERVECSGTFKGYCIPCRSDPTTPTIHNTYASFCNQRPQSGSCESELTELTAFSFDTAICKKRMDVSREYSVGGIKQWVQLNAGCMSLFNYDMRSERFLVGDYGGGVLNKYSKVYTICACKAGFYAKTDGIALEDIQFLDKGVNVNSITNMRIEGATEVFYRNYTYCAKCPAGTYSNDLDYGCTPCPPGYYSLAGASVCLPCDVGFYNSFTGASRCQLCILGEYQDEMGQGSCKSCPVGLTSSYDRVSCTFCQLGRTYPYLLGDCQPICNGNCEYWKSLNPNRNYQDEDFNLLRICTENELNRSCFDCGENCKYGRIVNGALQTQDLNSECAKCSGALMINFEDLCTNKLFSWKSTDLSPYCYTCQELPFELCDYDFRQLMGFTDDFAKFTRLGCVPFNRTLNSPPLSYGTCKDCMTLYDGLVSACPSTSYIDSCTENQVNCMACYGGFEGNAYVFNNRTLFSDVQDLRVLRRRQCQVMCRPGFTGFNSQPCDTPCDVQLACPNKDEVRVPCNAPLNGYCKKCVNRDLDLSKVYLFKTFTQRLNLFDFEDGRASFEHLAVTELDSTMCARGSDGLTLEGPGMLSFSNGIFDKQYDCKWDDNQLADQTEQSLSLVRNSLPAFTLENAFFDYGEWRIDQISYGVKHTEPPMPELGNTFLRVIVYDKGSFTLMRYMENRETINSLSIMFWMRLEDARVTGTYDGRLSFNGNVEICLDYSCQSHGIVSRLYTWELQVIQVALPVSLRSGKHRFGLTYSTAELYFSVFGLDNFVAVYNLYDPGNDVLNIESLDTINLIYGTDLAYADLQIPFYHTVAIFKCSNSSLTNSTMKVSIEVLGSDNVKRMITLFEKQVVEGKSVYTSSVHMLKAWEYQVVQVYVSGPIVKSSMVISPMQHSCQYACSVKSQFFRGDECIECPIDCALGQEFQGCTDDGKALCVACPNSIPLNSKFIFGTCDYVCDTGYYMTTSGLCEACRQDGCAVGFYRSQCRNLTGDPCVTCSTFTSKDARYIENEVYVTAGSPYNVNNCISECKEGSFRDSSGNCVPCRQTSFRFWEVRQQQHQRTVSCTRVRDAYYLPCGEDYDIQNGRYVGYGDQIDGDCKVECDPGYFLQQDRSFYSVQFYEDNAFRNGNVNAERFFNKSTCSKCSRANEFNGYYTSGCNFVCNQDFREVNGVCVYCPLLSCPKGSYQRDCYSQCVPCDAPLDPKKVLSSAGVFGDALSCQQECIAGYYDFEDVANASRYCVPCSDSPRSSCQGNQWYRNCTTQHDNSCMDCTQSCGFGFYKVSNCSAFQDVLCSICPNDLPEFSTYGENCEVLCAEGYVFTGSVCKPCNQQQGCNTGFYPTYCIAENNYTGCSPCVSGRVQQGSSGSVTYLSPGSFDNPYSCSWTCSVGFALRIGDNSTNFTTYCERQQTPAPQVDIQYGEYGTCLPGTYSTASGCQACNNLKPTNAIWTFRCNWACESGRLPRISPVTSKVECITNSEFEVILSGNPELRSYVLNPYQGEFNTDRSSAKSLYFTFGVATSAAVAFFCLAGCFFVLRVVRGGKSSN